MFLVQHSFQLSIDAEIAYSRKFDILTTFGFLAALQLAPRLNMSNMLRKPCAVLSHVMSCVSGWLMVKSHRWKNLGETDSFIWALLVWYTLFELGIHVSWHNYAIQLWHTTYNKLCTEESWIFWKEMVSRERHLFIENMLCVRGW